MVTALACAFEARYSNLGLPYFYKSLSILYHSNCQYYIFQEMDGEDRILTSLRTLRKLKSEWTYESTYYDKYDEQVHVQLFKFIVL